MMQNKKYSGEKIEELVKEDSYLCDMGDAFSKLKNRCKSESRKKMYGNAMNLVHKNRPYYVKSSDKLFNVLGAKIGYCICGNLVDEEANYCDKCGQRISMDYGWTSDDYHNEKGDV